MNKIEQILVLLLFLPVLHAMAEDKAHTGTVPLCVRGQSPCACKKSGLHEASLPRPLPHDILAIEADSQKVLYDFGEILNDF